MVLNLDCQAEDSTVMVTRKIYRNKETEQLKGEDQSKDPEQNLRSINNPHLDKWKKRVRNQG